MPHHTSCNIVKINLGGLVLKLCLVAFVTSGVTKAQNHPQDSLENIGDPHWKKNLANDLTESGGISKCLQIRHVPFRMELFLRSLKELQKQANTNIRRKKSVKRDEKKIQANEMRDKIKKLMSNITRTLNDVDWYFSYEQLDDEKNKDKDYFVSEPTQKLLIKRMKQVDADLSDVFVDSFVQQMYDLDPSILDKINNRIDSEFSRNTKISCDRELSSGSESDSDSDSISNIKRPIRLALASTAKTRRAKVQTLIKNEDASYVDEIIPSDEMLTQIPNYLSGVNEMFKHRNIARILSYDPSMKDTTTSTETTTYENFYDYGDYYRENEEDRLRDVAHYEIVQDVLQSTSSIINKKNNNGGGFPYKSQIKNKNKKARNFHKNNKQTIKKRLKDKFENFESKTYKDYNIESDY